MKVLKFGGSSVAKPERINAIVEILKRYYTSGESFTVVFSAFGGITDSLLDMARLASEHDASYMVLFEQFKSRHQAAIEALDTGGGAFSDARKAVEENCTTLLDILRGVYLVREASPRTLDYIVSFGERTANVIIAATLHTNGIPAEYLDARKIIKTDKNFGAAKVDFEATYNNINKYYEAHKNHVQIVTGFIGSAKNGGKNKQLDLGLTTTLGRGGSDYTAAILAAGLQASVIEIWTDVNGVLTADPRKVNKAFTIPTMTYAEAMEMSHFGAKVIYPPTLQPAFQKKIPLYIKNTFNPDFAGTFISEASNPAAPDVQGVSSISNVSMLTLQGSGLFGSVGVAGRLFSALAAVKVNVILITQGSSESSITFAVSPGDAKLAKRAVESAFEYEIKSNLIDELKIEENLAVIAAVGENMRYRPGIAGRLFAAMGKNGINCVAIAQGSSELNISVVIPSHQESKALNAVHEAFFLSDTKTLHLFVVGVGLIGSTLLEQIERNATFLKEHRSLEIKVVGLTNSRKMLMNTGGVSLNAWREDLVEATTMNLDEFIEFAQKSNLPNSIFIDNTSNANVAEKYEIILNSSIAISTPNKIANSGNFANYQNLQNIARRRGVPFLYETNVGAGLPVISTLRDLIASGDQILKIEGVLSGSLSFIFNNFNDNKKFSEIVILAKQLGYTEPDPRDDLSGADVRRKILILAREAGFPLESYDIIVENILPKSCIDAPTVAHFLAALEESDTHFETLKEAADTGGGHLRMIASLENGKAQISLQVVDSKSPFAQLSGSDNMIVFTTERYKERPLVVRGPGAGAEVTAAGIFAEIITIGGSKN